MTTPAEHSGHDDSHGHDREGHGRAHADHDHPHEEHGHDHPTGSKGFLLGVFRPHSHDSADSIDSALESSTEGIRALRPASWCCW